MIINLQLIPKRCVEDYFPRHTCMMSAFPLATPDATVPIPASETSLTETLAFGLTYHKYKQNLTNTI